MFRTLPRLRSPCGLMEVGRVDFEPQVCFVVVNCAVSVNFPRALRCRAWVTINRKYCCAAIPEIAETTLNIVR